jgi:hypothetical protein
VRNRRCLGLVDFPLSDSLTRPRAVDAANARTLHAEPLADGDTTGLEGMALLELEVPAGALRAAHQQVSQAHDRRRARIGQEGKETRHG